MRKGTTYVQVNAPSKKVIVFLNTNKGKFYSIGELSKHFDLAESTIMVAIRKYPPKNLLIKRVKNNAHDWIRYYGVL